MADTEMPVGALVTMRYDELAELLSSHARSCLAELTFGARADDSGAPVLEVALSGVAVAALPWDEALTLVSPWLEPGGLDARHPAPDGGDGPRAPTFSSNQEI